MDKDFTINIKGNKFDDFSRSVDERIKYIVEDEANYSSKEYFEAYTNIRKSKKNNGTDLLENLMTSAIKGGFDAITHNFNKSFDKQIKNSIDELVKQAVIKSGGKWQD